MADAPTPARFTKKPVTIDAILWTGENVKEVMDFLQWRNADHDEHTGLVIRTLEGAMYAAVGDYIIKGLKGEFYPCKPDIFQASYSLETATPSPPVAAQPATPVAPTDAEILQWWREGGTLMHRPPYAVIRAALAKWAQPQPQPAQPLTPEQIKAAIHGAVKSGRLSWMGYEKDAAGEYTVPVLSPKHYQLARAIEAAHGITAPSTPTPPEVAP